AQTYSATTVQNTLKRSYNGVPSIYDLQVSAGANEILSGSDDYSTVRRVVRTGSVKDDLANLFQSWSANVKFTDPQQENLDNGKLIGENEFAGLSTSDVSALKMANAQLVAYEEVRTRIVAYGGSPPYDVDCLAVAEHIVTPLTSAIVTDDIPILAAQQMEAHEEAERSRFGRRIARGLRPRLS